MNFESTLFSRDNTRVVFDPCTSTIRNRHQELSHASQKKIRHLNAHFRQKLPKFGTSPKFGLDTAFKKTARQFQKSKVSLHPGITPGFKTFVPFTGSNSIV